MCWNKEDLTCFLIQKSKVGMLKVMRQKAPVATYSINKNNV